MLVKNVFRAFSALSNLLASSSGPQHTLYPFKLLSKSTKNKEFLCTNCKCCEHGSSVISKIFLDITESISFIGVVSMYSINYGRVKFDTFPIATFTSLIGHLIEYTG